MTPLRLEPVRADITTLRVDAIVNAANRSLVMGGGVDGAVHRAAGRSELAGALARLGGCEPGDAKFTPGFALPARWIIHTVGPVWQGGRADEADILASCYRRSLEVADGLRLVTIAFPAIATGVFGFPADLAAEIAVATLQEVGTHVQRGFLVAFDADTLHRYRRLLGAAPGGGESSA